MKDFLISIIIPAYRTEKYVEECIHSAIEQDYQNAVEWYTKSSNQGYMLGQKRLADLYLFGKGVEKNYQEALKWFEKERKRRYPSKKDYQRKRYWKNHTLGF